MYIPKTMVVLHPGMVKSQSDGDYHHITFEQLRRLYGLHPRMCIRYKEGWDRGYSPEFKEQFIHLYPRDDGDYSMTTPAPNKVKKSKEE